MLRIPERSMLFFQAKVVQKYWNYRLNKVKGGHQVPIWSLTSQSKAKVGHPHQHPQLKVGLLMLRCLKLDFVYVYFHYVLKSEAG